MTFAREMLDNLQNFLAENPWLNLVFLVLAVISIAATLYTYFLARRERIPLYHHRSFSLLHPAATTVAGLVIEHNGSVLPTLTLTKVALWNRGLEPIRASDIAPADRLRIEIPAGASILGANVVYPLESPNCFDYEIVGSHVLVNFDYMSKGEGLALDIYHTAEVKQKVQIKGTIIGGRSIKNGHLSDSFLLDKLIEPVLKRVDIPSHGLGKFLAFPIVMLFALILTPFAVVLMPLSLLYHLFNPVPKNFTLAQIEGGEQGGGADAEPAV